MGEQMIIDSPQLRAELRPLASVCVIGHWSGGEASLARLVSAVLEGDLPECGQQFTTFPKGQMFRIQRSKYRIVSCEISGLSERLREEWGTDAGSLSEQSQGFLQLCLHGPKAEAVLRAGLPFDPSAVLPAPMSWAASCIGDANVQVARCDKVRYEVLVGRSFAFSLQGWLERAEKCIE